MLGHGGFGTVYKAELQGAGGFVRPVALKVLNRSAAGNVDLARRLRDEARLLGMIRHRAVVQVDGLVMLDDRWTVVMEYVQGVDLGKVIAAGRVPEGPALEIVAEVAQALHVVHAATGPDGSPLGLQHRDLKPTNVLLTPHGEIKVVDFGVARGEFRGREARTSDMTYGSPGYVAPERLDLEDTPKGDLYALGVVLYELVTGLPFGRSDLRPQVHARLVDEALGRARALAVDERVLALVSDLVAHDPAARPDPREVEGRARDARAAMAGPWLRDWAEERLCTLPPATVDGEHDFSTDDLVEQTLEIDPSDPDPKISLSTLPPDDDPGLPPPGPVRLGPTTGASPAPARPRRVDPDAETRLAPPTPTPPPPRRGRSGVGGFLLGLVLGLGLVGVTAGALGLLVALLLALVR